MTNLQYSGRSFSKHHNYWSRNMAFICLPVNFSNIFLITIIILGCLLWPSIIAKEIFQIFLAHNNQQQSNDFVGVVYDFKKNYSGYLDFRPVSDRLENSIYDSMVNLCTKMEPPERRIRAIVADVEPHTLNGLLMVSSYLHIPLIDIRRHFYANDPVSWCRVRSPLFCCNGLKYFIYFPI